jgi:hypothetical protein
MLRPSQSNINIVPGVVFTVFHTEKQKYDQLLEVINRKVSSVANHGVNYEGAHMDQLSVQIHTHDNTFYKQFVWSNGWHESTKRSAK